MPDSGTISPTRVEHVAHSLDGRIALIIDDGPTRQGIESTIVREVFGMTRILRHGPITGEQVLAALSTGKQRVDRFDTGADATDTVEAPRPAEDEWMIGFGPTAGDETLSASGDLTEAATRLFDLLHRADASDKPKIAVAPVPDEGIGEAINDRLRRAAHRD